MTRYLQVAYNQDHYWGRHLRAALEARPKLESQDRKWRRSSLSDLAFSISTRLGALQELVHLTDQALGVLGRELGRTVNLDELVDRGYGYSFDDDTAVRQVVLFVSMFVAEGESLAENLAEFYRTFNRHYFDKGLKLADAQREIVRLSSRPGWRKGLDEVRNFTRHRFAPWLAFEDKGPGAQPRWEPVLVKDWRPEKIDATTTTSLGKIRDIRDALALAAKKVEEELIKKVKAV